MTKQERQIPEQVIKQNLEAVEKGQALTIPLAVLNGQFKKEYFKTLE